MLSEWLLFLFKGLTVVGLLVAALIALVAIRAAAKNLRPDDDDEEEGHIAVQNLREKADDLRSEMEKALHDNSDEPREIKSKGKKSKDKESAEPSQDQNAADSSSDKKESETDQKSEKSKSKKKAVSLKDKDLDNERDAEAVARRENIEKLRAQGKFCPRNLYVIEYDGDIKGSDNFEFAEEINAVLEYGTSEDELIVNLSSPGGMVNAYGYASSQLSRVREKGIKLTVCVDEVAASGGYLMAAVADRIVASPFAYIGSIGVVAEFPNFNRLLEKHSIDYEQVTAGKYKRTLTMLGKNTPEAREKMKGELEAVHKRFKGVVSRYRPSLDIDNIATGEYWLGDDALQRGLVDEISTSDSYIRSRMDVTSGSALKIMWRVKEKKHMFLKKVLEFFSAKVWIRALGDELLERSGRTGQNSIR